MTSVKINIFGAATSLHKSLLAPLKMCEHGAFLSEKWILLGRNTPILTSTSFLYDRKTKMFH